MATSGTLTFMPGETVKTVAVQVLGDTDIEPDEVFHFELTDPINASLMESRGVGQILQDDIALSIGNVSVTEGNSGSVDAIFELTLDSPSTQTVRQRDLGHP